MVKCLAARYTDRFKSHKNNKNKLNATFHYNAEQYRRAVNSIAIKTNYAINILQKCRSSLSRRPAGQLTSASQGVKYTLASSEYVMLTTDGRSVRAHMRQHAQCRQWDSYIFIWTLNEISVRWRHRLGFSIVYGITGLKHVTSQHFGWNNKR